MSSRLYRIFICDHEYGSTITCTNEVSVPTGSIAYGTDYSKERQLVEEAGWAFGSALKVFCPEHLEDAKQ